MHATLLRGGGAIHGVSLSRVSETGVSPRLNCRRKPRHCESDVAALSSRSCGAAAAGIIRRKPCRAAETETPSSRRPECPVADYHEADDWPD